MAVELMEHQSEVIPHLRSGSVLYGGVGAGKTITVLAWYEKNLAPKDIYVITTARKRDSLDWEREAAKFAISTLPENSYYGMLTVDSWNNISRYEGIQDALFIFDEQRLVGYGAWVRSFIKIAKQNAWVLLSATPGDSWMDYMPVMVANGFYKNKTDFIRQHVRYEEYSHYPKIKEYVNTARLRAIREEMLVEMPYIRHTQRYVYPLYVGYDEELFNLAWKKKWHVYENRPLKDAAERFRVCRRIVSSDPSRMEMLKKLLMCHQRLIVWYTYDYELEILRGIGEFRACFEWNGHVKDPLPEGHEWVYLVQYAAGAEAWNCVTTNAMVFWSLTYSYKSFEQAQGRIDRVNTPYTALFYYILLSKTPVDAAVERAQKAKKNFNERKFMDEYTARVERTF